MKTLDDVMICPNCGSDMYQYNTDEYDFSNYSTGYLMIDCHCKYCNKDFRLKCKFTYDITDSIIL